MNMRGLSTGLVVALTLLYKCFDIKMIITITEESIMVNKII